MMWNRPEQRGLDEALGLAAGFGRVRPGAHVPEAELLACLAKGEGFVTRLVVGCHALDCDAEALIVGHGGLKECDGALPH